MLLLLERTFTRRLAQEIRRESASILNRYTETELLPPYSGKHVENITRLYRQMTEAAVEVFGQRIIEQGKEAGLILETKNFADTFRKMAQQYIALEMIRRRITSVAETTRQQIVDQISAGEAEGLGVAEIARQISKNVTMIARNRGALIARTETHGAANYGANEAAKETGLKLRKEWVAAEDERTRTAHVDADGQVVDMDQPFRVGGELLMYPGDPAGSAGNIINCRCAVSHIVDDDLE